MTELINNKKGIEKIINEKIKNKKINFTKNFCWRNAMRGISNNKVLEIFPQFDKIIAIEKKILKFGDIGYELFYSLSDDITFSIALCPVRNHINFVHAIEYKRSLAKRLKIE